MPRAELDKRVELLAAGQCRDLLDATLGLLAGAQQGGPASCDSAQGPARAPRPRHSSARLPPSQAPGAAAAPERATQGTSPVSGAQRVSGDTSVASQQSASPRGETP